MYDENEISQRLVAIRTFVSPALFEEIVKLFPFLKLQNCLKLELHDLEVLGDDVCLSGSAKFLDPLRGSPSKVLAVFASFYVVLQLLHVRLRRARVCDALTQLSILSSARAKVVQVQAARNSQNTRRRHKSPSVLDSLCAWRSLMN